MRYAAYSFIMAVLCVPTILWANAQDEMLWHYRNLGKAFYENSATQYEAVETFKKALELAPTSAQERVNYGLALLRVNKAAEGIAELEQAQKQDPSIPHTWFNLGMAYKRASQYDRAIEQLAGMLRLVPDEAITHYNLGVLYKLDNQHEKALTHFERAATLDPNLTGPHFQLATAYRQAKRPEEAKKAMETFQRLKKQRAGAAVPEDLEWSYYAEIYETIEPQQAPAASAATLRFAPQVLEQGLDASTAGLLVLDVDGDLTPDLLLWSATGVKLYQQGKTAMPGGLEDLKGVVSVAAGDFDNDGLVDLCVLTAEEAVLYKNSAGKFTRQAATLPAGSYRQVVWLDFDHDYDLDLVLLGTTSALARNNGQAGFANLTSAFPFVPGTAIGGVRLDVIADTQGLDLVVTYADRPGVLYRDRLSGQYEAIPLPGLPQGANALRAFDMNNDGWTDLAARDGSGLTLLTNDRKGGFRPAAAPAGAKAPFAFADLENRMVSDLVASAAVFRNTGLGAFATASTPEGFTTAAATAVVTADFDRDQKLDVALVTTDGTLQVLRNVTEHANGGLRIGLKGVKNPKLAPGAEVEVKAGRHYQKQTYDGLPLFFGVGAYQTVDAVRITWPNGTIQNETRQSVNQAPVYEEAQRLSGSCPMIFTWNGHTFEFITDVLGVAPLGASAGNGEYFPVDHDEYVQIDGASLVPVDGWYDIRVTEELREVAYIDAMRLITIDHPAQVDVFTNDKFKGPPFPEFRLFGVQERTYPVSARDHHGQDVLDRLRRRDRTYPDGYSRDYAGVAELHHLELDFGAAAPDNRAILVLSGWVDWADGSTFLGMAQQNPAGLILPYLQVKNAQGEWQTVIEDMGIPAGKPKTIVVDLSGKFLSKSRQMRIVTNLCVYWDEIFLGPDPQAPAVQLTELPAEVAGLRFRGFSEVVVHAQRRQPEQFVYGQVRPWHKWNWNPTPGLYTRYGDVKPLLAAVDDLLVIMGSGDELQLRFNAKALPALPAGWKRDFLLFVDGWAKDGDANTAFSQTVEPLPFHAMPQYPYEAPHAYPADGVHTRYREFYNTRPALQLIRPLYRETEEIN